MNVFGERLRQLRGNMSIDELVNKLNDNYESTISKSMISRYENGESDPKMSTIRIIADYFKVSADYLTGMTDEKIKIFQPELTAKDKRNIQKDLQKMIKSLDSKNSFAAFGGETMDDLNEEDRELLIASLEKSLEVAKKIAKQKFTPKKYRE